MSPSTQTSFELLPIPAGPQPSIPLLISRERTAEQRGGFRARALDPDSGQVEVTGERNLLLETGAPVALLRRLEQDGSLAAVGVSQLLGPVSLTNEVPLDLENSGRQRITLLDPSTGSANGKFALPPVGRPPRLSFSTSGRHLSRARETNDSFSNAPQLVEDFVGSTGRSQRDHVLLPPVDDPLRILRLDDPDRSWILWEADPARGVFSSQPRRVGLTALNGADGASSSQKLIAWPAPFGEDFALTLSVCWGRRPLRLQALLSWPRTPPRPTPWS